MNVTRLWAKNCRTWREVDLSLAEGVTAVVGENGAGKSTLVNIADFALFGGRDLARLVTRGSGEAQGEVGCEFEHGDRAYRVTRRFGAKPSLDLERSEPDDDHPFPWQPLTRETMAATQAELEELLGLDRQSFRASAFLAQGDGAAFTEAQPRERKEILSRVLGLGLWERLRERAAADRAERERVMAKLLGAIEEAEGQLSLKADAERAVVEAKETAEKTRLAREDYERGLLSVTEELEEAKQQWAARNSVADQHRSAEELARVVGLKAADAKAAAADALRAREELEASPELAGAERLEDEARAELAAAELSAGRRNAAKQLSRVAEEELDASRGRLSQLVGESLELERHLEHAARAQLCPTCGQQVEGESAERVAAELQAKLDELGVRRDEALDQVKAAEVAAVAAAKEVEQIGEARTAPVARERFEDARRRLLRARDLRSAAAQLDTLREKASAAEGEAESAVEKQQQLYARLRGFDDPPDLEKLQARRAAANAKLSDLVRASAAAEREAAIGEGRLEHLVALEARMAEQKASFTEAHRWVVVFKKLEEAFGRNGVPALILDAIALPFLEEEASRVIAELGRAFRVELRSQRATKGGDLKEALDIVIVTPEGEADYADFSGGEQTRLNIALRVALARLLASRRGADVRFLVIDEPTHLDEAGFARLAEVLRGLEEFDRIMVVSHVPALRDAFDHALAVEGGGDSGEPSRLA